MVVLVVGTAAFAGFDVGCTCRCSRSSAVRDFGCRIALLVSLVCTFGGGGIQISDSLRSLVLLIGIAILVLTQLIGRRSASGQFDIVGPHSSFHHIETDIREPPATKKPPIAAN